MNEYTPLVLLVEDNPDVLHLNSKWLAEAGFDTLAAQSLGEAREVLTEHSPDIVVLDILLPDGSGLAFLPECRTLCDAPVLICSSRGEDNDILLGFKAGGDDYMPKPYNMDILVAKVRAMWRREQDSRKRAGAALATRAADRAVEQGILRLDMLAGRAYVRGRDAGLRPKEFALLFSLVQNAGRTLTARELYESAWGLPATGDISTVKVHISKMKKRLQAAGWDDVNIMFDGEGYCLVVGN